MKLHENMISILLKKPITANLLIEIVEFMVNIIYEIINYCTACVNGKYTSAQVNSVK